MPKRLTLRERLQVACYCPKGGNSRSQWTIDTESGHPVCCLCRKPSPEMNLRICADPDCRNEFVLPFGPKWSSKYVVFSNGEVVERGHFCDPCMGR